MLLNEAIKTRLKNLMKEKNVKSKYELSCEAGINPSIVNDFFRSRTLYLRVDTLYLLCEGLGITLEEFFKDPVFNIENIEIKDSKD